MPVSEHQAEHAVGSTSGAMNRDGLSSATRAADLTPTAAWSRRVRWIGGLIQAAFAAFWLVRGSVVIGGARGGCAGRGVWRDRDWRVLLRDHGRSGHRPPAKKCGGQADRASRHDRHRDRVRRGDRPAGDRQRRRSLGLGAAVDRDHDRTAAAVARPPGPYPSLPAGRMGADRRAGDPRRDDVRHAAHRHHGHRRRGAVARYRPRRLPRPRGSPSCASRPAAGTAAVSVSAGAQP